MQLSHTELWASCLPIHVNLRDALRGLSKSHSLLVRLSMESKSSLELDKDVSHDQMINPDVNFDESRNVSDDEVLSLSQDPAQESRPTTDTPFPWQDDPTNPMNRSTSPEIRLISDLMLESLDSDEAYPDVTAFRHQLELRRARMRAIESVPDKTLEARLRLRDVLGDSNWPTHFQTFEGLHATSTLLTGDLAAPWSHEDEYALRLLVLCIPSHVVEIASIFFPERESADVFAKIIELFPLGEEQQRLLSFDVSAVPRHAMQNLTQDQIKGMLGVEMAVEVGGDSMLNFESD